MAEYALGDLVTFTKHFKDNRDGPDLFGESFEVVEIDWVPDKHLIFADHTQFITIVIDAEEVTFSGCYFS